ncbi:MAG: bile acid:sodium symporter family protein [Polyangiales bacterium]
MSRSRVATLLARIDPYLLALFGVVALASLLPARGAVAPVIDKLTDLAITFLFFLYGARLSPQEAWEGARNVRLHVLVLSFTYVLFPLLGLATRALSPWLITPELYVGLVFLGALPSTVQSSIAFTSIARGNVAAALCAASASNLLGVLITPLLVALMLSSEGVSLSTASIQKLVLQLLAPFALGQLLRPRIGGFVTRHKKVLGLVDRGSILLVVYSAFSEGVVAGIWQQLSLGALLGLGLVCTLLLALVLALTTVVSRRLGFDTADEIAIVFCGSKKSLASGLPMASVLFPASTVSLTVLPLMLFHQIQLVACAWLARRYAARPREAPVAAPATPH